MKTFKEYLDEAKKPEIKRHASDSLDRWARPYKSKNCPKCGHGISSRSGTQTGEEEVRCEKCWHLHARLSAAEARAMMKADGWVNGKRISEMVVTPNLDEAKTPAKIIIDHEDEHPAGEPKKHPAIPKVTLPKKESSRFAGPDTGMSIRTPFKTVFKEDVDAGKARKTISDFLKNKKDSSKPAPMHTPTMSHAERRARGEGQQSSILNPKGSAPKKEVKESTDAKVPSLKDYLGQDFSDVNDKREERGLPAPLTNEELEVLRQGLDETINTDERLPIGFKFKHDKPKDKSDERLPIGTKTHDLNPKNKEILRKGLDESKMSQLYTDIEGHLRNHIKKYKNHTMGADTLGMHTVKAQKAIAKKHNIEHKHAVKFVNDYVEGELQND